MFWTLQNQESTTFTRIVTRDAYWFFLEYFQNRSWRLGEENTPAEISQKSDTEKHMLTIFWSTMRPLVEKWLPEHGTFNSTYFCDVLVPRLTSSVFPDQGRQCKQRVYVHVGHVRSHNSKDQFSTSTTTTSQGRPIHHIRQRLHGVICIVLALKRQLVMLTESTHNAQTTANDLSGGTLFQEYNRQMRTPRGV
jgi:hypothetical protein